MAKTSRALPLNEPAGGNTTAPSTSAAPLPLSLVLHNASFPCRQPTCCFGRYFGLKHFQVPAQEAAQQGRVQALPEHVAFLRLHKPVELVLPRQRAELRHERTQQAL